MNLLKTISIFTLFLSFNFTDLAFGQKLNTKLFYHQFEVKDEMRKQVHLENHRITIFSSSYIFYKRFISSQDVARCVFTPSCSEYALQNITKHGVFIGLMASFDRLSRCNAIGEKPYPIHNQTHLYYDPIR